tara:strand:+ start:870 stop:1040 length:171 start_codon:yes stop_codon:yes gene_type:complete
MKKLILLFFIVAACSNSPEKKSSLEEINIYDNLSFDEFKSKFIDYVKNTNYPDIKK